MPPTTQRRERHVTTHYPRHTPTAHDQASFSIPSLLSLAAAIGSFAAGPGIGLLLAAAAIVLGLIGAGLALQRRVRGGLISIISVVAGLAGVVAAAVKLVLLVL